MHALTPILASEGHEPNGIIFPSDTDEIIWGTIAFCLIVFALYKFAWGPIKTMSAKKAEGISDEIDTAETARQEATGELDSLEAQLADAPAERERILTEARETATGIGEEMDAKAQTDAVDMRQRALRDIEVNKHQAMADLEAMVGELTLGAAELVVRENLDQSTQDQLVDTYIAEIGSSN